MPDASPSQEWVVSDNPSPRVNYSEIGNDLSRLDACSHRPQAMCPAWLASRPLLVFGEMRAAARLCGCGDPPSPESAGQVSVLETRGRSDDRGRVQPDARRLRLGQEGREIGRCRIDTGEVRIDGLGFIVGLGMGFSVVRVARRRIVAGGDAGRQTHRGGIARRPVDADRGRVTRRIEGLLRCGGECCLLSCVWSCAQRCPRTFSAIASPCAFLARPQ